MNKEDHNIEWKESWRDEYLKWVCGFANAQGGKIYIGIDDHGNVKGVIGAKKLLDEIPNKTRSYLGILVDVNRHTEAGLDYLEIVVGACPSPISFNGRYYYRSGSTKQELTGAALNQFLLEKQGKKWDGVPMPQVKVSDLSAAALTYFRQNASRFQRVVAGELHENGADLLDKLHLFEGEYLKRAAVLLFHPDPEKYVTGAYVKLGYFSDGHELLFQDVLSGCLFDQVEHAMQLLLTKYLRPKIVYDKLKRVERYPYPEGALREALLNTIVHKDYSGGNPVQISVYDDRIIFSNDAQLPPGWTVKRLMEKHQSKPFNPDIALAFFRAGLIEAWGSGTLKIIRECTGYGLPKPHFFFEETGFTTELSLVSISPTHARAATRKLVLSRATFGEIWKLFEPSSGNMTSEVYESKLKELGGKSLLMIRALYDHGPLMREDLLSLASLSYQTANLNKHFVPLVKFGIVAQIQQQKPKRRNVLFALTELGILIAKEIPSE